MTDEYGIERTIDSAEAALREHAVANPATRGMGTTVVGLLISPTSLAWFNVGDSRLYQYRSGFLRLVSIDDAGGPDIGGDEPRTSNVLLQWLGSEPGKPRLRPHIGIEGPPLPSRWLLCSDGLWSMLPRAALEDALRSDDIEAWISLFGAAMEAGADDNISFILISITPAANEVETNG